LAFIPTLVLRYRYSYLESCLTLSLISEGQFIELADLFPLLLEILINTFFAPPGVNFQYSTPMLGGQYTFRLDSMVTTF
jgi:hypothetical protein